MAQSFFGASMGMTRPTREKCAIQQCSPECTISQAPSPQPPPPPPPPEFDDHKAMGASAFETVSFLGMFKHHLGAPKH